MRMSIWLAVFAIFGTTRGYTPFQSNQYMDTVMYTNLRKVGLYANIDPAYLTNFNTEHKDKVMFVKVNVKINYTDGNMTGLFEGRRDRDCSSIYRDVYGNPTLNCTLAFDRIKFRFGGKLKYGKLPSVSIQAEADMSKTVAYIEVSSVSYPQMKRLNLVQIGKLTPKFTGLGPLNKSLKTLAESAFIQRLTSEFVNVFTHNYSTKMSEACSLTPLPV